MKILFDQGTPVPSRHVLSDHDVPTAHEMGWSTLDNGSLLSKAERHEFDVLMTTDKQLNHRQNLRGMKLAVVDLTATSWPKIQRESGRVIEALQGIAAGEVREVQFST